MSGLSTVKNERFAHRKRPQQEVFVAFADVQVCAKAAILLCSGRDIRIALAINREIHSDL
jgi:hypothetical protein